ncbi:MAG TPA: hypothetical protein VFR99_00340 [Marmoricola sp.]|nr:hypothetical protein [Marmoricola sp.]
MRALTVALLLGVLAALSLAAVVLVRHWRRERRESFACRMRPRGAPVGSWWPRRPARARWVHDVLVVSSGPGLLAHRVLPVATAFGAPHRVSARDLSGLGDRPEALEVQLDDDTVLQLAAAAVDRNVLVGPYLTATLTRPRK